MTKKKRQPLEFTMATADDLELLADMLVDSHKDEIFSDFGETERPPVVEWFGGLIEQGCVVLAKKSSKPIGALALATFPLFYNGGKKVAQVFFWWVDREHRGNGVGEAMMLEGERIAKELDADMIVFTVRKDVPAAARLCVERGYKLGESQYYRRLPCR